MIKIINYTNKYKNKNNIYFNKIIYMNLFFLFFNKI